MFELKEMKCPSCGYKRKLSIAMGEPWRFTWCMKCNKAVVWEVVKNE